MVSMPKIEKNNSVFLTFRYFKPYPRWNIRKELGSCTLLLPNSCPIQIVEVQGDGKLLKQLAALEACKLLHQVGELTDNLVPNILEEEADTEESGISLIFFLFLKNVSYCWILKCCHAP